MNKCNPHVLGKKATVKGEVKLYHCEKCEALLFRDANSKEAVETVEDVKKAKTTPKRKR